MYGHHIYQSMDQPGKAANPARGQLNRENEYSPAPYVPENLVSRDGFSRPVPRQPAHLHTQAESGAYLRDFSRVPRQRPFIYLNRHTPSGQSRVYRVTQLRTDGVHCRESAGTGPLNLKVVPNECCLGRSPWMDPSICPSLSHTHKTGSYNINTSVYCSAAAAAAAAAVPLGSSSNSDLLKLFYDESAARAAAVHSVSCYKIFFMDETIEGHASHANTLLAHPPYN